MKPIYFDYNATTPIAPEVYEAMEPYLKDLFANPSSIHQMGKKTAAALRDSRRHTAQLLGVSDEREIIFTSGGTESNNAAIRSLLAFNPKKREIVTSQVEHSSVGRLCQQLEKEDYQVHRIGVDAKGQLNLEELKASLNDQTALVTLMLANNETGVIFPIEKIGQIVKESNLPFHVDAVQAGCKIPIHLTGSTIDMLSLSGHKFYGPKGVGILYVRGGIEYRSLIFGGSQERGRRGGTENVPGIIGLGAAAQLALSDFDQEHEKMVSLRKTFEELLQRKISDTFINGDLENRLPNTSNIGFRDVDGEALLFALDQKGVCTSSGSACMSGAREPSHVLKAMGLNDDEANASLRFSFGRYTQPEEIETAVNHVDTIVAQLRTISLQNQHPH